MASVFLTSSFDVLRNPEPRVEMAEPFLDKVREVVPSIPDNDTAVRANAVIQIACGVMLAKGIAPRIAALVLAGTLVPTTVAGHPFWKMPADKKPAQKIQFLKNLSIIGGLLVASADTDGKPSLAWRAQHIRRPDWVPEVG